MILEQSRCQMGKFWIMSQCLPKAEKWTGFRLFPFAPQAHTWWREQCGCSAAARHLGQVQNVNHTVILLKDNTDVYSLWKPLDKRALCCLPQIQNATAGTTSHRRLLAIVSPQQDECLVSFVSHWYTSKCREQNITGSVGDLCSAEPQGSEIRNLS